MFCKESKLMILGGINQKGYVTMSFQSIELGFKSFFQFFKKIKKNKTFR
jgi:hypothetical protein